MIKLIAPLLAFTALFGGEDFFLLPDQNNVLDYRLNDALRNSSSQVTIITPSFSHSPLKKALLRSAKMGIRITVISTKPTSSTLSMIQYDNVNLYRYTSRPLNGSLIIVDNNLVCTLSAPLIQEELENMASFAHCGDDPDVIAAARRNAISLIKRAKPYLDD